jgi:hypothetical protein
MALPDGPSELFNLDSDPGETSDRSAAEPERTRSMVTELRHWMTTTQEGVPSTPSNRIETPDQTPPRSDLKTTP